MLVSSLLSFYRLTDPAIAERERELAHAAEQLSQHLPIGTKAALAPLIAIANSYYSNLLEGYGARPIDVERAVKSAAATPAGSVSRNLADLAATHVEAEAWARAEMEGVPGAPFTGEFVRGAHRAFAGALPAVASDAVEGQDPLAIVAGELRSHDVAVGEHVAPPANKVADLLAEWSRSFSVLPRTPAHILLGHHRLAWIHPFLDGNGRAARIVTTAQLAAIRLDSDGSWSLSRGLANNKGAYMERLAAADSPRNGSYDGRGALSLSGAQRFADFMLGICEGQVNFMGARLRPERLRDRIFQLCSDRALLLGRDERASHILFAAMAQGSLPRAQVPGLLGLGERAARMVVADCVADGLLAATSHRADLNPGIPVYAAAYLFPHLFEIADPQEAMVETVRHSAGRSTSTPSGWRERPA